MDERRDFTIDQANFGDLPEYFEELRSNGMRTIIILVCDRIGIILLEMKRFEVSTLFNECPSITISQKHFTYPLLSTREEELFKLFQRRNELIVFSILSLCSHKVQPIMLVR